MPTGCLPVLVVDDDALNRIVLTAALQQEGLTVLTAADGRQALDQMRAAAVAAVFLDLLMPEMDGYEVLAQVKADPVWRDIPVVVVSGESDRGEIDRCLHMGAVGHLPKPFDPVDLRAALDACLINPAPPGGTEHA